MYRPRDPLTLMTPINFSEYVTPNFNTFTAHQDTAKKLIANHRRHLLSIHRTMAFEQERLKRTLTKAQRAITLGWECQVDIPDPSAPF